MDSPATSALAFPVFVQGLALSFGAVPIETALFGIPRLQYVRSISLFGLSDVKLYFDYGSDYFRDRQEAINRMQFVSLPQNISPQLSPWSPIGEIYRYRLDGPAYSLNELK